MAFLHPLNLFFDCSRIPIKHGKKCDVHCIVTSFSPPLFNAMLSSKKITKSWWWLTKIRVFLASQFYDHPELFFLATNIWSKSCCYFSYWGQASSQSYDTRGACLVLSIFATSSSFMYYSIIGGWMMMMMTPFLVYLQTSTNAKLWLSHQKVAQTQPFPTAATRHHHHEGCSQQQVH